MADTTQELATELVLCARYGELEDLQALVAQAGIAVRDAALCRAQDGGPTPLHMAAANGHVAVLSYLLAGIHGPEDANVTNDEGSTPLHWAALNGHAAAVEALLARGARATLKNKAGKSAVTVAAQADHVDVMDLLLKSYDPDEEEDGGDEELPAGASVRVEDEDADADAGDEGEASGASLQR
ncbi:ankyrin repeat-containing protein [Polyrhizophydium stewartii]|uniref:protein S-acyltransferase n=1 Tax=Polyrhizophydium stewartii TaxID=2732419 RepID=A0ABR4ND65_9FUNG